MPDRRKRATPSAPPPALVSITALPPLLTGGEPSQLRLRLDLVERFSRLPYRIAACMEPKLAGWLPAQGFAVGPN